jgi:hypothetical protein
VNDQLKPEREAVWLRHAMTRGPVSLKGTVPAKGASRDRPGSVSARSASAPDYSKGSIGTMVPRNVSGLSCLSQNVLRCSSCGLVCGMAINRDDYYVITFRPGQYPDRWSWEIRRKSKPLGIKMIADGFQSEMAAEFAGKRALANFLTDLWKEERRAGK